ncbi:MAG: 1-(5-phosphoribosyl)-5-[(5-phosphoribosylamino)methylideneamino] imidazole-4-carboxamide isomerase [Acidimicrobiia bacterium]|nr:1-(5-phosphoribosyl)-5-[(5-phosphoribosylamino)methylideneamino] imidazole-4-carboxamide isomerase [Acidimicrobiia bacterium]
MQVIPAVDVLDGAVVRLRQGRFDDVTTYGADPVAVAKSWVDEGATLVHVVDLNGARFGEPDRSLWASLSAAGIPFQIGGGIRTADIAADALEAGAQRVVLGTAAVWSPEIAGELVERFGPERVVAAVDVRDGSATGSGWEEAGRPVVEVCRSLEAHGVEWILATGIDRDGMMSGPDTGLLDQIRVEVSAVQLIASGGVAGLDDIVALRDAGYEAVVVGRALYESKLTLADALRLTAG